MISRQTIRNIGISAHIDSGKTTLSERILYYTGKIHKIEEVRGGGEGAKLDFMPLEKEKGITITSAATSCTWKGTQINLIDTPGHVDFTIEVERALRVLDGAIMVLCAVAGVQSQSITVDRQMKRYQVPRIAFINKMDRSGANPLRVVQSLRDQLSLNPVLLQYPIASENTFAGVIDLIEMTAHYFDGENGEILRVESIPEALKAEVERAREKMLDQLSLFSEPMMTRLLEGESVPNEMIWQTIREATLRLEMVPVLMGSAFKNKGVQNLLDAVILYLPAPNDRALIVASDLKTHEQVGIPPDPNASPVALAFKVTDEAFGQLTYVRVYAGTLQVGQRLWNTRTGERVSVSRLVRMHADERQELTTARAGDIVALVGVDCASGDTFCGEGQQLSLEGMFVPEPVISLAISPKRKEDAARLSKALNRFSREDPTFRISTNSETGELLISGMGELHLSIYVERMRREYGAEVDVGKPAVAYRETLSQVALFDCKFKKQSGGPGQYAHITGRIEPCEDAFVFENRVAGGAVPKEFIPACEKGFRDAIVTGFLIGYPVVGVRVILEGGSYHPVDSSEMAFRSVARQAFEQAFMKAKPLILEPVMLVEVETPSDFVGRIQGDLTSRRGILLRSETGAGYTVLRVEVPLSEMFGYSTTVRSLSRGMAGFSMELADYRPMPAGLQQKLIAETTKF